MNPQQAPGEVEPLRIRPVTLPEKIVDALAFQANRRNLTPHELMVRFINEELEQNGSACVSCEMEGPGISLLLKLPSLLDAQLERVASEQTSRRILL